MTRTSPSGLFLLAGLLAAALVRADDPAPHELLDRMNEAVRLLDYEGRFVVQTGDRLDAMYIVHRVDAGSEKERVVSLTGQVREIIRSDHAVVCLVPEENRYINVGRRAHGRSFSPLRAVSAEQLNKSYQLELLEPERVAGRPAHQILIVPRDDLRFGYRLFIDQATALPLQSVMTDGQRQVVSQMMFVEMRVGEAITPIEHDLSAMQVATPPEPVTGLPRERLAPAGWEFPDLPNGFELNVHRRRAAAVGAGESEHFIFSDGLATLSVYVQPGSVNGGLSGTYRLGPAMAVGRVVDGHQVIVVGEVPVRTLTLFAEQIRAADR